MNTIATSRHEAAVWKKIPGELVNPVYVVSDKYSINQFGEVRNDKTGRLIKLKKSGRYYLSCTLQCGYPLRATYTPKNLMYAAFNNVDVYYGRVREKNPNLPLHIDNLVF